MTQPKCGKMRQDEVVNGSQMVVKIGVVYYRPLTVVHAVSLILQVIVLFSVQYLLGLEIRNTEDNP